MREEYSRTAMLIGEEAAEKLQKSHLIIFGLGGVGSYVAEALARVGTGALTLVDGDTVSLSNINRQLYALHSTVGKYKTEVAGERISDINPLCKINIITDFVTKENIDLFFKEKYDFCIDAIDDTNAKTAIAVKCDEMNIPLIASMGTGAKLSGEFFKITDINKTEYCPLCRVMRKKYRDAGLKKVTVLYSPEMPEKPKFIPENEDEKRLPPSSISFIPSQAGLRIAEYTVKQIIT
ncbi:MAG: tRNA threonylcarbamoyladenosine dehydratase [Ruminococcaceae bacterium]|nr:tRNA threonylcarbamoyladenosine dehydratase [Oscillospiraceae bacterium]MBR3597930.1 tRNA threonylcarbamoyladenosine dehydratase [Clostridia bacterium]